MGTDLEVKPKQYLTSPNGQYSLVMRPDCKLVVYNHSQPFVGTNFSNHAPSPDCSFWMQTDGNLVIYNFTNVSRTLTANNSLWAVETEIHIDMDPFSFLLLGDDGSSSFYNSNSSRYQESDLFDAIQGSFGNVSELNNSDFQVSSNADYTAWKLTEQLSC